jgi:hypothetical protein
VVGHQIPPGEIIGLHGSCDEFVTLFLGSKKTSQLSAHRSQKVMVDYIKKTWKKNIKKITKNPQRFQEIDHLLRDRTGSAGFAVMFPPADRPADRHGTNHAVNGIMRQKSYAWPGWCGNPNGVELSL